MLGGWGLNKGRASVSTTDRYRPRLNLLFISDKLPQIDLEIMRVDLHLLKTILAKCPQSYALHQRLVGNKRRKTNLGTAKTPFS